MAPGRARRPGGRRPAAPREQGLTFDPSCPFCPGNESATPPELYRAPEVDAGDWSVRVVSNKYPALAASLEAVGAAEAGAAGAAGLAAERLEGAEPALGRHEVIIETPVHDRDFTELDDAELLEVMRAYRARYAEAATDERIEHILIFRNSGPLANASLPHPHSQFVGLSFVPPAVAARLERSRQHREREGRPLFSDLVEGELRSGARVVEAGDRLVSFVPYAPNHDYEIWVAPRLLPPRFQESDEPLLLALGRGLRRALAALGAALGDPDYNLILHFPPLVSGAAESLPWYVQIVPRITVTAGFELGLGVHILVTTPEAAAEALRDGLDQLAGS